MEVLLRMLIPLLFAVSVSAGVIYGVFRGIRALQKHFGLIDENEQAMIGGRDPLQQANEIAGRIRSAIQRDRDEGGELAEDFEREVKELLEKRLVRILENRSRLSDYLSRLDRKTILAQVDDYRIRLKGSKDAELKAILEKNFRLASERADNLKRLETLAEKTEAQIKAIILGLQNLEDKVLSLRLLDGQASDKAQEALDSLRGEVDILENEYRKLEISYDG